MALGSHTCRVSALNGFCALSLLDLMHFGNNTQPLYIITTIACRTRHNTARFSAGHISRWCRDEMKHRAFYPGLIPRVYYRFPISTRTSDKPPVIFPNQTLYCLTPPLPYLALSARLRDNQTVHSLIVCPLPKAVDRRSNIESNLFPSGLLLESSLI